MYQPGLGLCDNLSVQCLCFVPIVRVDSEHYQNSLSQPRVLSRARCPINNPTTMAWSGPGLHTLTGVTSGQVKTNSERGENTGEERSCGDNNIPDDHRPAHTQPHVSPESQRWSWVIIIINTREAIIININNSNTPPRPNGWPVTRGEETSHSHSGAPPRQGWPR